LLGGSAGAALQEGGGGAGSLTLGFRRPSGWAFVASVVGVSAGECYDSCETDVSGLVVLGGGVQLWLRPRVWMRAIGGVAGMESNVYDDTEGGFGWAGTVGWDMVSGRGAALDLRFGLLGGFFERVGPVRGMLAVGLTIR